MTIPLAAFILTFQDDTDVLVNAVRSLAAVEGMREILICDTGPGVVRNNPRPDQPTVRQFCDWAHTKHWPVVYMSDYQFQGAPHYGAACNYYGKILEDYPWIIYLGSDEMLTIELCRDLPDLLAATYANVATIAPKQLSLYPNEQTYSAGYFSTFLTHGRIYRPRKIEWELDLHEHQRYQGEHLQWDNHYILHFRQLFEMRCRRQCGHGAEGGGWSNFKADLRPVAELGVSWLPIEWPQEERHNEDEQ